MSVAEVLAAFPGAISVPSAEADRDGSKALVQLASVEIAGCPFRAKFFFRAEKLHAVTLACQPQASPETERVSSAVEEALRAKYGAEISRDRSSIGWSRAWYSAGVKIGLRVFQVAPDDPGNIIVFYNPSTGQDAGKL